ncbi:nuclear transport factor 2 family protein [Burkholderia anthina]|uniref:nuclear transport factor 2 family protein n=1 Tax=Burkholderia anthina TaxID=179879 RepID=UPI001FC853B7|nr:nuclear transport factor 2 family protein [Burkholderia anthina]
MNGDRVVAAVEIEQAHSRYARALDERNWSMLDTVFAPDVRADYNSGEFRIDGRAELVAMIRAHLDGCGPTQHLLGTPHVEIGDGHANSRIYVRATHRGAGARQHLLYEALGEYVATWKHTPDGWRAVHWELRVNLETGTRDVLGTH